MFGRPNPIHTWKFDSKRKGRVRTTWLMATGAFLFVFVVGMAVTNWGTFAAKVTSPGRVEVGNSTVIAAAPQAALSTPPQTIAGAVSTCMVLSVHDGDTFRCDGERIRIANIDAPELPGSPKCEDERRLNAWCDFRMGGESRDTLRAFFEQGDVQINRQGKDNYGRTLATVSVNGIDAGEHLIQRGLAKRWQ